jgi:hypothetical protein
VVSHYGSVNDGGAHRRLDRDLIFVALTAAPAIVASKFRHPRKSGDAR